MDQPSKPTQRPGKGPVIVRGTRCAQSAPERLSGHLGHLQCALETDRHGLHAGDHRAHHTVHGVGKVKVSWKNKQRADFPKGVIVTYSEGPPVVDLREDAAINPYLTGQVRKRPECECPEWWKAQGSKMHHSPCRLI